MRIAVAATTVCLSIVSLVEADNVVAAIRKETAIPAETLDLALRTIETDRNLELIFVAEDVREVRTQGASGNLTLDETLTEILAGTGLTYHYVDDRTVTILPPPVSAAPTTRTQSSTDTLRLAQQDVPQASRGSAPDAAPAGSVDLEEVVAQYRV